MRDDRLATIVEARSRLAEAAVMRRPPDALLDESGQTLIIAADHPALYPPGNDVAAAVDAAVGLLPRPVAQ